MRDELKSRFLAAINLHKQGGADQAERSHNQLVSRQEFEKAFEEHISIVIAPALKEVAQDLLVPAGWICKISRAVEGSGIVFKVYRADKDVGEYRRPSVSFLADRTLAQVWVQFSTGATSHSTGILMLDEIGKDAVQQKVLQFFETFACKDT